MMVRKQILKEAQTIVCEDRERCYGKPEDNFGLIAKLWTDYLNIHRSLPIMVCAHDVAMMMILLKVARAATGEPKMDNYIDIAGYAACAGELALR